MATKTTTSQLRHFRHSVLQRALRWLALCALGSAVLVGCTSTPHKSIARPAPENAPEPGTWEEPSGYRESAPAPRTWEENKDRSQSREAGTERRATWDEDRAEDTARGTARDTAQAPSPSSKAAGAAGASERYRPAPERRPGLATHWGERRTSYVHEVSFARNNPQRPLEVVTFHYDDAEGVELVTGRSEDAAYPGVIPVAGGALTVSVVEPDDDPLPLVTANGRRYVIGDGGDRYVIRIDNHTSGRFEIVASVDGLDVLDGSDADTRKPGYLVDPWGTLRIEGFRESADAVRAFRFGNVRDSYAAQRGRGRNIGVVGVALFEERGFQWGRDDDEAWRRETASPFPRQFAPPPARD